MSAGATIRLGTRASRLALAQSTWVADALRRAHPHLDVALVPITTSGDRRSEERLADVGGKGLFLKEIEDALLGGEVDFAVHSMKDVPAVLPSEQEPEPEKETPRPPRPRPAQRQR